MPTGVHVREVDDFVIERAKYWWKSARQRKNPFDKFISGWISFNILYNFIIKKYHNRINLSERDRRKEAERVKSTVKFLFNEHIWTEDLKNSIEALIGLESPIHYRHFPIEDEWISTETLVSEIREDIRHNKKVEALVKTYEILYHVRCNLFHGDKSDDNQKDIKVIDRCWEVMKNSYPAMLKSALQDIPLFPAWVSCLLLLTNPITTNKR